MAARLLGWIFSGNVPTLPNAELSKDHLDAVTYEPLTKAVTLIKCGHNFNENTAKTLMDKKMSCPLDRRPIEFYVPNVTLRNIVDAALQQQPQLPADNAPAAAPKEEPSPAAVAHFEKGKQLFADHQYEHAVNAFLAALILHPTYEKAQAFFESSLEAQKINPPSATASAAASSTSSAPSSLPSSSIPKQSAGTIPSSNPRQEECKTAPPLPSYVTEALNRAGRGKALIKAVEEENTPAIRYLLSQDTQVDSKDGQNRTPLLVACQKKNEGIIHLLIGNGAPVDGDDARAALIEATEKGHREVVKILVNEGAPMMNKMGPRADKIIADRSTPCIPLEVVIKNGDSELLKFFLTTQNQPNGLKLSAMYTPGLYNPGTTVGRQALITALNGRKLECAGLLIEAMEIGEFLQNDLLLAVCQVGDLGLLLLLWKKGIGLDQKISDGAYSLDHNFGQNLLLMGCHAGDQKLVQSLLEKGVDLDKYATNLGYSSDRTFRHQVLYTLQNSLQKTANHGALIDLIRSYRCNGREPIPMPVSTPQC